MVTGKSLKICHQFLIFRPGKDHAGCPQWLNLE